MAKPPDKPPEPLADIHAKMEQELRRGVIVLATLSQLREAQYGYSLRQALAEQGMSVEEGTLYPLLRRLEGQGLLASEWRIEDGPPRRYYTLSETGKQLYADLTQSWRALSANIERLVSDSAEDQSKQRKTAT
ncbi:MAG TPA: PadR family transcriptional regulator [Hyphomonadaceae bacterium]|jgi:DNA-binding PadR family transcriptional regulator|nr:PadR family transcriptional regulator [Hyphomonadaceae bacterium]